MIDESNTDSATSLALYQITLTWAARNGDRFILGLRKEMYDSIKDLAALTALGRMVPESSPNPVPRGLVGVPPLVLPPGLLYVEGPPNDSFVVAMTKMQAPESAVSGDNSPAELAWIFKGTDSLYRLYDYGSTQILDLGADQRESLIREIEKQGLKRSFLIPVTSKA